MRIMGLDYGSKTVGVAISDALGFTAQGVEIVRRENENKLRKTFARLEELIKEYSIEYIVLGLPKNMNNTLGERVEKSLAFKEMLEKRTSLEIKMWDERLTTIEAIRTMQSAGVKKKDMSKYVDQIAATYILQGYLDYIGRSN